MAKNKVSEWSATPADNTDVGGIDINEGCAPSGINNAIRDVMAQIKGMQTGADGDNFAVGGNLTVNGTTTLSTPLPVASGGTGATTSEASRAALGLGTLSTQAANNVAITGGSITGITDLAVADGGTGSSTLTANAVLLGNGTNALQTVAPSTSGNVLTSNGTTWTSATPAGGIGIGQTWQNVIGSRASGVTYTNSTGKPIMVATSSTNVNGFSYMASYCDGIMLSSASGATPSATPSSTGFSFIVPAGSTYSVTFSGTGINTWVELR
jgi:hypothetical protein